MGRHGQDSNRSLEMGKLAEQRFFLTLIRHGYGIKKIKRADRDQERHHIDFVVDGIKYEIKSKKRIQRWGESLDQYCWVEITNWSGYAGWLFGRADKIAFETNSGFLIVSLAKLQQLVANRVKWERVSNPCEAVYRVYTQCGQPLTDLTLVPMVDMESIAEERLA